MNKFEESWRDKMHDLIKEGQTDGKQASRIMKSVVWGENEKYPSAMISEKEAETSDTLSEVIGH